MGLKKILVVLNGFVHDFATGYWLSAMISIWFLARYRLEFPAVAGLLTGIQKFFFWNSVGAVVIILATGAGRTVTYVDNVFGEGTEQTRRKMLIAKHVVLLTVFGVAGWLAWRVTFHA
jgi:uncharacterized membrane protein